MPTHPVHCPEVPSVFAPYPVAVKGAGLIFLSGLRGARPGVAPAAFDEIPAAGRDKQQGFALVDAIEGMVAADAWAVHETLEIVLAAAGSSGEQLLRQHIWQRDKRYFPIYENIRMHWQPAACPSSGLGIGTFVGHGSRWYGVDGIAVGQEPGSLFGDRVVVTPADNTDLPSASFYSQAVQSGPLAFLAGHIPINTAAPGQPLITRFDDIPEEGRFLATGRSHPDSRDGPIAVQSWYVYNELRRTLATQGLTMDDVVHLNVYLSDLRDFPTFHRVHRHFFPTQAPALCVTGFDEVGHRGCRIEIELTALRADHNRRQIDWACAAPFAGAAAVQAGPIVFFAGMLGLSDAGRLVMGAADVPPSGRSLVERLQAREHTPGCAAQCWMAWSRLAQTAAALDMPLSNLAKTLVYLAHSGDFEVYEAVREAFISAADPLPACECVVIQGPGPTPEAAMQIDAIGIIDEAP